MNKNDLNLILSLILVVVLIITGTIYALVTSRESFPSKSEHTVDVNPSAETDLKDSSSTPPSTPVNSSSEVEKNNTIIADNDKEDSIVTEATGEEIVNIISSEERYEFNIFLSNLSEAGYDPVDSYYNEIEAKISFVHIHAYINDPDSLVDKGQYMGVSAEYTDKTLNRFFGKSIPHETPADNKYWFYEDGNFLMPSASGESYSSFSIITSVIKTSKDTYSTEFNVYHDPSIGGGNVITDKSLYALTDSQAALKYPLSKKGSAILKEKTLNGKKTFEIVKYDVY